MTDTQADLTERARATAYEWLRTRPVVGMGPELTALLAAFAQSEREAAAAEARRHLRAMLDLYSEINDNPVDATFWEPRARAAQLFLASPAPQDSRDE